MLYIIDRLLFKCKYISLVSEGELSSLFDFAQTSEAERKKLSKNKYLDKSMIFFIIA